MSRIVDFCDLNEEDTRTVLTWRNHPAVRKWMYRSDPITPDEHQRFIGMLKHAKDKQYFLVFFGEERLGVVYLTDIDLQERTATLGVYANPEKKSVGTLLMDAIIDYAFNRLHLMSIRAEVFRSNARAVSLYEKFGFHKVAQSVVSGAEILQMELKYKPVA